jgi:hypothetical protein
VVVAGPPPGRLALCMACKRSRVRIPLAPLPKLVVVGPISWPDEYGHRQRAYPACGQSGPVRRCPADIQQRERHSHAERSVSSFEPVPAAAVHLALPGQRRRNRQAGSGKTQLHGNARPTPAPARAPLSSGGRDLVAVAVAPPVSLSDTPAACSLASAAALSSALLLLSQSADTRDSTNAASTPRTNDFPRIRKRYETRSPSGSPGPSTQQVTQS